jgi:hypothetical protein
VTTEKPTLTIAAASQEGSYSGQIDVNGVAEGGDSTLTLKVRDHWVGVSYLVELWLSRWRPRSLLDRGLGRLISRAERRRERFNRTLANLFAESHPDGHTGTWQVPQAATTATSRRRYDLNRAAEAWPRTSWMRAPILSASSSDPTATGSRPS